MPMYENHRRSLLNARILASEPASHLGGLIETIPLQEFISTSAQSVVVSITMMLPDRLTLVAVVFQTHASNANAKLRCK